jgi:predicted nicotinamide N-methyase
MGDGTVSVVLPQGTSALAKAGAALGGEPPYWADIWPASVAIARWVCRRRTAVGIRALDLGCGLGLPGCAAVRHGARVTFADFQPDALAFAEFNAAQQIDESDRGRVASERIRCVEHDWHRGPIEGPFDWIFLADVSYRPVHHLPILRQLQIGLSDRGIAIHSDPGRKESDGFLVQLRRDYAVREVASDTFFDGVRHPVRLNFAARSEEILDEWLAPCAPRRDDTSPPIDPTGPQ